MRHRKKRTRFGRQSSHRKATLRNLTRHILIHQRIKTTKVKAKETQRVVEKLITIAKEDSLAARRQAFMILQNRSLVGKLFNEIAPLFKERRGGYTRIIPFDFRKGDGADMVLFELTEKKLVEKPKVEKRAARKEKLVKPKEIKREEPAAKEPPKPAPEVKPQVKEEKTVEEAKKEKAKKEAKKIEKKKNILKKVKGFFRRKSNM